MLTFFARFGGHRVLWCRAYWLIGVVLVVTWAWKRAIMRLIVMLGRAYDIIESTSRNSKCMHHSWRIRSLWIIVRSIDKILARALGSCTPLFVADACIVERDESWLEHIRVGRRFLNLFFLGKQFRPGNSKTSPFTEISHLVEVALGLVDVVIVRFLVVDEPRSPRKAE